MQQFLDLEYPDDFPDLRDVDDEPDFSGMLAVPACEKHVRSVRSAAQGEDAKLPSGGYGELCILDTSGPPCP